MGFVGPTKAALAGELVFDQGLDLVDTTLVWRRRTILQIARAVAVGNRLVDVVSLEIVHCGERVVIHFVGLKCGRVGVEPVAHRYTYMQDEVGRGGAGAVSKRYSHSKVKSFYSPRSTERNMQHTAVCT